MKNIITISLIAFLALGIYIPITAYAGGPGFEDDVKTWEKKKYDDDDRGDDDHWGDDDRGDDDRGDDDRGDDDWNDDDSNDIPLDGGLSFLAVAGAAYGVKRIRDNRKNKNDDDADIK